MAKGKTIIHVVLVIILLAISIDCVVDRTYFNYLGLKITASAEDIEKAYQEKKLKVQTIENEEQKAKKTKMLQSAYKTLKDEKQRAKYERYGKDVFKGISEITSINQYTGSDSRKGPDMKIKLPISIEQLFNGTTVKAQFQTKEACSKCMGTGAQSPKSLKPCSGCGAKGFRVVDGVNKWGQPQKFEAICPQCQGTGKQITKTCPSCQGKKLVDEVKGIDITIPAKYSSKELKLRNHGYEQELGAPSDFVVEISEIPSTLWRRNGNNLVYTMEVSFQESIFGFSRSFFHLNGEEIVIDRNEITTKDTKVNLPGKGFSEKGKLTVEFKINIPQFTDRQLDRWEEFFEKYNNL